MWLWYIILIMETKLSPFDILNVSESSTSD